MKRLALLLLVPAALWAASAASVETVAESAPAAPQRLSVALLTEAFVAEVVARIEAARTESERLEGGYLQETTGLIWARRDNNADVDWYAADDFCDELEVADWSDWRMPTIDELESLHERRSNDPYKLPAAIKLTGCCPWSSTLAGDGSAWNFSFRYRKRFSGSLNYSYELRALCVRAASEEDIAFYELAAEEAELEANPRKARKARKRRS